MKKIIAMIVGCLALMMALPSSPMLAGVINISSVNVGPTTWTYSANDSNGFTRYDKIILNFKAPANSILTPPTAFMPNGAIRYDWSGALSNGGLTATWTVVNGMTAQNEIISGFGVTSNKPNGPATWSVNSLVQSASGTTAGPTPEPSTYVFLGIGGLLVAFRLRHSGVDTAFPV